MIGFARAKAQADQRQPTYGMVATLLSDPWHANTSGENVDTGRTNDEAWGESAGKEFRTALSWAASAGGGHELVTK